MHTLFCPILTMAQPKINGPEKCREERCAWYCEPRYIGSQFIPGRCALTAIAEKPTTP